jgi:hypothetical protein
MYSIVGRPRSEFRHVVTVKLGDEAKRRLDDTERQINRSGPAKTDKSKLMREAWDTYYADWVMKGRPGVDPRTIRLLTEFSRLEPGKEREIVDDLISLAIKILDDQKNSGAELKDVLEPAG